MSNGAAADVAAAELVDRFGSPLYVYDLGRIRTNFERLRRSFRHGSTDLHYAVVCNKNREIVRRLYEWGCGVHANTPGDAAAALTAGVSPERIVYSGTNLDAADLDYLMSQGIPLNLDSLDQLRLRCARGPGAVGLRLLIDEPSTANRIGVAPDELRDARTIARQGGVRLVGLHMYAGTNNLRVERCLECLDRVCRAARQLPDIEYVDVGGGFGVDYRDGSDGFDLEAFGAAAAGRIAELSRAMGRSIRLVVEPGRVLVGDAGVLYVTVVSVKERGGRRFVGVDSTIGNIVVESVYHRVHRLDAVDPRGAKLDLPTDVCGNTTHSRDFLARGVRLPEVRPGDLLALRDVGAYGYAMSSHFLNRPRPAEVVWEQGEATLTTRRETFADLVATQLDVSPAR